MIYSCVYDCNYKAVIINYRAIMILYSCLLFCMVDYPKIVLSCVPCINILAIYENNYSTIYQVGIRAKAENFCCCLVNTSSILFHPLRYHIMFSKTDMSISNSKKPSMVTIHEIASPIISIKLDGANYHVCSQILEMHIASRKKKGYIT